MLPSPNTRSSSAIRLVCQWQSLEGSQVKQPSQDLLHDSLRWEEGAAESIGRWGNGFSGSQESANWKRGAWQNKAEAGLRERLRIGEAWRDRQGDKDSGGKHRATCAILHAHKTSRMARSSTRRHAGSCRTAPPSPFYIFSIIPQPCLSPQPKGKGSPDRLSREQRNKRLIYWETRSNRRKQMLEKMSLQTQDQSQHKNNKWFAISRVKNIPVIHAGNY